MTSINKTLKNEITNRLTTSIQKVLESPELKNLSDEQIEQIAKAHYIDSLKEEFSREVKKTKFNNDVLQKYIDQWLSGFQSQHTVRSFKKNLDYFLIWLNGSSIVEVDALVVDKYITYLNSNKKISDNTKRQRIASCGSFFSDLERWRVVDKNPFLKVKGLPKKKISTKDTDQIPTNEELDLIERYALDQIQRANSESGRGSNNKASGNVYALCSLKILRRYGLRVGALQSIKIDRNGNYKATSKGNEISGKFDDAILVLLDTYGLGRKEPFKNYNESAFSMWIWRCQSSEGLSGLFKKKFSPHGIRHRFAIDFYNKTKDVNELSKRLSHSSLLVTTAYLAGLKNEIIETD